MTSRDRKGPAGPAAGGPDAELERLFKRIKNDCLKYSAFKDAVPVFGSGPVPSAVMIVGEAPGREETKEGLPFVGKAGRFLVSMLEEVFGKGRDGFYITNVVKVWPTENTKRLKTRKPLPEEEEFFIPYLEEEIRIAGPKAIIAVGKTAFSALAPGSEFTPGQWCGSLGGIPIMPVYHPSYLLRRQKTLPESAKRFKEALRKVRKEISR